MIYQIKLVTFDGVPTWKFLCPNCEVWGYIDDDQLNGRVSILCECGFHKTINLKAEGVAEVVRRN